MSSVAHNDKCFIYDFFKPWLGSGLLISSGEKWHHRRRILTPAFHFSILEKFFDTIVTNSKLLVQSLESETNVPKFDIIPYLTECSLHNICETAMGVKMKDEGQLKKDFLKSTHIFTEEMHRRVVNPFLHFASIFRLTSGYKRQTQAIKVLHEMSTNVIEKRKKERLRASREKAGSNDNPKLKVPSEKKEFLDVLLDISEQDANSFTINDVREEVDTFMFEGHDTVSIALYWTIFLVGHHPDIQKQVHTELDDVLRSAEAPENMKTLQQLKYLECVIKESMRLYPSVPILVRQSGEDAIINGYEVPKGTIISINVHRIHKLREHYHNPDQFDPSHFFPENVNKRHPFAYLPFSGGPRNCIGQKFAMMEMKIVLSMFFKYYEVESVTRREDLKVSIDTLGRADGCVWVRICRRMEPKNEF